MYYSTDYRINGKENDYVVKTNQADINVAADPSLRYGSN
jgi:hypothetical protein